MKKFNNGDKVMRRNGFVNTIYTVVNSEVQSKDRVVIADSNFLWYTERVVQNNLRKISRAEISLVNSFYHIMKETIVGDRKVSPWTNKFNAGDTVLYKNDMHTVLYKIMVDYSRSRGRVVAQEIGNPTNSIRVSQNSLRKVTKAELSVIRGYSKLIEDVIKGN